MTPSFAKSPFHPRHSPLVCPSVLVFSLSPHLNLSPLFLAFLTLHLSPLAFVTSTLFFYCLVLLQLSSIRLLCPFLSLFLQSANLSHLYHFFLSLYYFLSSSRLSSPFLLLTHLFFLCVSLPLLRLVPTLSFNLSASLPPLVFSRLPFTKTGSSSYFSNQSSMFFSPPRLV